MKKILAFALAIALAATAGAQHDDKEKKPLEQIRKYWFVLLKTGPDRSQDSATAARIQAGHLANIGRLYEEGKIKVAGPFAEPGDWKGIFIFDAATREEVEGLLKTDPAIASGRLGYEIRPWYTAPIGSFTPGKPKKE
jgi:uncharacterized protein